MPTHKFNSLAFKLGILVMLLILSTIPRLFVDGLIDDRKLHQAEALQSVSWAAPQTIGSVKIEVHTFRFLPAEKKGEQPERINESFPLTPKSLSLDFKDAVEIRKRGIYEIPIFKGDLSESGTIVIPEDIDPSVEGEHVTPGKQVLTFALTDSNSFSEFDLNVNGRPLEAVRTKEGFQAKLDDEDLKLGSTLKFSVKAHFVGHETFQVNADAQTLDFSIDSKWPSPSFVGQAPVEQTVTPTGFHARWHLIQPQAASGVNYVQPVDIYMQVSRALKYGFVISLLVLSVLFLLETLSTLRVQSMHYFLITLPLSFFYVLVLAASEQIGFATAYAAASVSVITLLSLYVRGIGATKAQTGIVGGVLTAVYTLVLTMLTSEDYALLIGSIALFVCLATFMLMTTKVDWSGRFGSASAAEREGLNELP